MKIIDPKEKEPEENYDLVELPSSWRSTGSEERVTGVASYLYELDGLDAEIEKYSLFFDRVYGSARVYIVDSKTRQIIASTNEDSFTLAPKHTLFDLMYLEFKPPKHGSIRVIIHLSNHELYNSGIFSAPRLGVKQNILKNLFSIALIEFISLGIILSAIIYNFMIWLRRKEDKIPLLLAFSAVIIAVRVYSTSSITAWLNDSALYSHTLKKMKYLTIPLMSTFAVYSSLNYFCQNWLKSWISYFHWLCKLSALSILALPVYYFERLLPLYQIELLITIAVSLYIAINSLGKSIDGANMNLLGIFVLACVGIWDTLIVSKLNWSSIWLSQLGAALYFSLQSQVIAVKNAKVHKAVRKLAQENEAQQRTLRLETQSRLNITSTVAHYVNNPLNYIQLALDSFKVQIRDISSKVESLFESEQNDPELEACKLSFKEDFDELNKPIVQAQTGLLRAADTIQEIRGLSGLDGNQINQVSIVETIEASLERLSIRLSSSESQRINFIKKEDLKLQTNPYILRYIINELLVKSIKHTSGELSISYEAINTSKIAIDFIAEIKIQNQELTSLTQQLQHLAHSSQADLALISSDKGLRLDFETKIQASA